jgi:hypothetical protein
MHSILQSDCHEIVSPTMTPFRDSIPRFLERSEYGTPYKEVYSLAFDPVSSALFAGTGQFQRIPEGRIPEGRPCERANLTFPATAWN